MAAVQIARNGCVGTGSLLSILTAQERQSSSSSSSSSFSSVQGQMYNSSWVLSGQSSRPSGLCVHGWLTFSTCDSSALWPERQHLEIRSSRRSCRVNSSKNGAANAISKSSDAIANAELTETDRTEEKRKESSEDDESAEQETASDNGSSSTSTAPFWSMPNFSMVGNSVTLYNPLSWLPNSTGGANDDKRPLLLYVPGMDGSGQGIRSQMCFLIEAGYDIRCVYIPCSDRSSWQQLVDSILPLVEEEVRGVTGENRHLTVLGESFGGGLAMRLAKTAPSLVRRLVLLNPATNFSSNNLLASIAARTGLLSLFPEQLYQIAQDILLPLLVKRNRVSEAGTEDFLSPIDLVPASCASWRLSMLNDSSGLEDEDLGSITMPTLLIVSAKDRVISSMAEGARLQLLLPNAKRVVLPESGHTALFEDSINIADLMLGNGFPHPAQSKPSSSLSPNTSPLSPAVKREEAVADEVMDELGLILEPWRILTSPLISGAENLPMPSSEPRRPVLFVGNHTMFGAYDSPLLVYELYLRGFRCRGLAHPGHWLTGFGGLFERYGNVKATKVAAYRLLKEGENVLLFPGGAREVCKRKGEEYKLLWRETADFVRMACRHKAIIVPFGALGGDEAFDILYDTNEVRASPIGPLIEAAYNRVGIDLDNIYPVTAFPGTKIPSPFPIPSIERIYFHFAEPIDTLDYASYINDRVEIQSLYEMVKKRVEDSIEQLKVIRSKDPERELPVRLLAKLGRLLPEFMPRMRATIVELPNESR